MQTKVDIILFEDKYTQVFADLNFEWLEKHFYIEDYDREVLTNPRKYILDDGGTILLASLHNQVIGTAAYINRREDGFELSKMAVSESFQGQHIGQQLMDACLDFAKKQQWKRIYLDSNTKLPAAISLYRKVGFTEIPVPTNTPYKRCNIRMEMYL